MSKIFFLILVSVILCSCSHTEKNLNTELLQMNEVLCLLQDNTKDIDKNISLSDINLYFILAYQSYTAYGYNNSTLELIKRTLANSDNLFYREAFDLYFRYALKENNLNIIEPYIKKKGIPTGLSYAPLLEAIYLKKTLKPLDMIEDKTDFIPAVAHLVKDSVYEKNRQYIIKYFVSLVSNVKKRKENKPNMQAAHFLQMFKDTKEHFYSIFASWLSNKEPEQYSIRQALKNVQSLKEGEVLQQLCAEMGKRRDFSITLLQEKDKNPFLQCLYAMSIKNSLGYSAAKREAISLENQFPKYSEERFSLLSSRFFNTDFTKFAQQSQTGFELPQTIIEETEYTKEFPFRYNAYLITSAMLRDILENFTLEQKKILKSSIEVLEPQNFSDNYVSSIAYLIEMIYPDETKWSNYLAEILPLSYANLRNNGGHFSVEQKHPNYPENVSMGVTCEEKKWSYFRKYNVTEIMKNYIPPSHLPNKDAAYLYTFVRNFLEETGDYYEAMKLSVKIAELLYGSAFAMPDLETLKHLYPLHYKESVEKWSQKYNVEQALIWAIMREESRFQANIVSSAAAIGLMQVMPATASWLAPKIGIKQKDIDLTNADQNIQFGVYFLSYLQTLIDSKELIAAGYNAGQGRAKKWQHQYKKYPGKTRYEMLPIEETRHYIRKVMQSYYVYSYLLSNENNS